MSAIATSSCLEAYPPELYHPKPQASPLKTPCRIVFELLFALFPELLWLLFLLQQRTALHDVVMFTTVETSSELFPLIVSGLA